MKKQDLDALGELYSSVYGGEQLNEIGGLPRGMTPQQAAAQNKQGKEFLKTMLIPGYGIEDKPTSKPRQQSALAGRVSSTNDIEGLRRGVEQARKDQLARASRIPTGSPTPRPAAGSTPTRPGGQTVAASGGKGGTVTVGTKYAATLGGKKGNVTYDSSGKKTFTEIKPASGTLASTSQNPVTRSVTQSSTASAPKPPTPEPKIKQDVADLRRMQAASMMRQQGRNLPSGKVPTSDDLKPKPNINITNTSGSSTVSGTIPQSTNTPVSISKNQTPLNLKLPKKPMTQANSYEWPSAKTIRDIADAYAEIYEAKKKVDQDQDGDNDFADVRIARMVASGVPKEVAIAKVKGKSYNEAARGAQRGVLTPKEKKQLGEEYQIYEIVASYLLENNFAETINDANVIIENMSENWLEEILNNYN